MNKGDIVSVLCPMGEFVGKLIANEDGKLELEDPRLVVSGEQGLGFAKGIAQTGKMEPEYMCFNQYSFITESNEEVQKAYRAHTSGIVTP